MEAHAAWATGAVLHFMMGAIFGVVYAALWSAGVGSPTWWWGALFGVAHGIVAALVTPLMQRMHPRPEPMPGGASMVAGIIMGHLVFGILVGLAYR